MKKFEDRINEFNEAPKFDSGLYYWIWAVEYGKPYILGWYNNSEEAENVATNIDGYYEIYALGTKDKSKATRLIKNKRFEKTGKLTESAKSVRHKRRGQ